MTIKEFYEQIADPKCFGVFNRTRKYLLRTFLRDEELASILKKMPIVGVFLGINKEQASEEDRFVIYVTDYQPLDLHDNMVYMYDIDGFYHVYQIFLPESCYHSFDKFYTSAYSEMYTANEIKRFFRTTKKERPFVRSQREEAIKVLNKSEELLEIILTSIGSEYSGQIKEVDERWKEEEEFLFIE